jgi:hypothetical protein
MSDNSTAMAVASSAVMEYRGGWRAFFARLAAPCIALWQRLATPAPTLALHELSQAELLDIGAPPELLAEAQALREFEYHRANAMSLYYW